MPNNSFRKVKVDKRSGFDKSHRNSLTGTCGTLIPILVDEHMPDTKIYLKEALAAALPPLVSDTYMNVRLRVEAFVVPHRLCQANFDDFFSDYPVEVANEVSAEGFSADERSGCMPLVRVNYTDVNYPSGVNWYGNGSLMDYMGIPAFADNFDFDVVAAPFIAYHLIWQEWYRNPRVQKPAFIRYTDNVQTFSVFGDFNPYFALAPFTNYYFGDSSDQPIFKVSNPGEDTQRNEYLMTYDGKYFCELRQRNFGLDFFTAAMVEPQQGPAAVVKFGENGDPADGFTIASLRAQNSIQQFRERNNLTSPRYQQQIYARYGVAPSDGVIQRPVLIGAATYDVYSHGVVTTAATYAEDTTAENFNVFGGLVGARQGNGFASGNDVIIDEFHVKEPMYLIVLASLVPEVTYSQNFEPLFVRYQGLGSITDMANGILQNVGPQPIPKGFLGMADSKADFFEVFAYTDRYSDWMIKNNQCHGQFKVYQGGSLFNFVSQRTFTGLPEFGSEFLEIPIDYLDDVMQYGHTSIGLSFWLDIAFEYKVSMPLQEYAIPSLQDPGYEHGRTISLRKNGQLL